MLLQNYPKNSTAFYLMGCIYEKKGEITQGIEYFHKAIEIDPNNVYALFSRGACYNMLGNYEKAIEDYSLALEKDSNRNGRKTILRNIGKVLGLNSNENILTNNSSNLPNNNNNNMNLSVNPFDEKSNMDMNNSSYFNLNSSKTIENLQIENEMNKYINHQLRDIISGSAGAGIPNSIFMDKLGFTEPVGINASKNTFNNINNNQSQSQGYNGILNGNSNNLNNNINNHFKNTNKSVNNTNISNNNNNNTNSLNNSNLRNTNSNFYNCKNDSLYTSNSNSNNITNNRLKGANLDSNIFSNFKESARNRQNYNNDFISPDDKINENLSLFNNNKNINLNSLLGQNLNPTDIDNLIFSLKNNNLIKSNSGILENLKLFGKEASCIANPNNSEFLQKNSRENFNYTQNSMCNNTNTNSMSISNSNNTISNMNLNMNMNKAGNGQSKIASKSLNTYPKSLSGTNFPHEMNNDYKSGNMKTSSSINSKSSVDKRDKSILLILSNFYWKTKFNFY